VGGGGALKGVQQVEGGGILGREPGGGEAGNDKYGEQQRSGGG
jgi:hypothetical protein